MPVPIFALGNASDIPFSISLAAPSIGQSHSFGNGDELRPAKMTSSSTRKPIPTRLAIPRSLTLTLRAQNR